MKIYDTVDNALSSLGVAYYDSFADDGGRPDLYIVYSLYDTTSLNGDGKPVSIQYTVTFNIFGNSVADVDKMHKKLFKTLLDNGFVYGGCSYSIDSDYPNIYRRIIDFKISLGMESED